MFDDFSDDPVYNIKAIAQQSGIMASTLRAWERRYGVPRPERAGSGYRLYSSRDIAVIRWLKAQIDSGMSISHAVSLLNAMQQGSRRGTNITVSVGTQSQTVIGDGRPRESEFHDRLLAEAVLLNEIAIEAILKEAFSLYPIEHVCMYVIQPALVVVGERWHRGEININVEHFFSNLMCRRLHALLAACPPPIRQIRIIAGCAPGDLHEMGILMISLFLRRRGYDVIYLGQNISLERLEELLQTLRPHGLLLSAGTLLSAARLMDVAEFLAKQEPQSAILAYGGHIFNAVPELRFQIPGYPLSLMSPTALMAIDVLGELLETPNRHKANAPELSRETRAAAIALHGSRVLLLSDMVATTQRMADRSQTSDISEQLLKVLEAGVRLNLPLVLQDLSIWEWDIRLSIDLLRLRALIGGLEHAIRRHLTDHVDVLLPYIATLKKATTLYKD